MSSILTARILQVEFSLNGISAKTYAYFTTDETIKVGDYVVVIAPDSRGEAILAMGPASDTAPGAPLGYPKIVRVVSTEETVEGIERVREWIVCKIDFAEYVERKALEEKRKLLNAKIKRAVEDAKRDLDLTDLASRSPALAELLKQRDAL